MLSEDATKYLAALSANYRLKRMVLKQAIDVFGGAEKLWSASGSEMKDKGMPNNFINELNKWKEEIKIDVFWEKIIKLGLKVIRKEDYLLAPGKAVAEVG